MASKDVSLKIKAKDQTRGAFGSVKAGLGSIQGQLALIIGAAGLGAAAKQTLDFADSIGKLADRAGITTDRIQTMSFAFDLAGVGTEAVNKAMLTFGKRLGKARQGIGALAGGLKGGQEELLETLKATKNINEALDVTFRAMGKAKNQAEKLAIADAAFGAAGLRMTAAFRDGSKAFFIAEQKARDLGLVIDEKLIRSAEEAKDQMLTVSMVLGTQVKNAFLNVAPFITAAANSLLDFTAELKAINSIHAARDADTLSESYRRVHEEIAAIDNKIKSFGGMANILKFDNRNSIFSSLILQKRELRKVLENIIALQKETKFLGQESKNAAGGVKELNVVLEETAEILADSIIPKDGLDKALESFDKLFKNLKTEAFIKGNEIQEEIQRGLAKASAGESEGLGEAILPPKAVERIKKQIEEIAKIKNAAQIISDKEFEIDLLNAEVSGMGELIPLLQLERQIEAALGRDLNGEEIAKLKERIAVQDELNRQLELQNRIADIGDSVFDRFGDGIVDSMQKGGNAMESFRDAATAALFDIQRELVKLLIFEPFKKAILGGAAKLFNIDGFGGKVPTPGRASGGSVSSGSPYMVGEQGPELFVPGNSGTIIPNGRGQGGGGNHTTILIDARGSNGDAAVEAAVNRGIKKAAPGLINASVQRVKTERQRDPKFF